MLELKEGRWIVRNKEFGNLMEISVAEIQKGEGGTFVRTRLLSGKTYWNTIDEFNEIYEPISEIQLNKSVEEPDEGFSIRFRRD